MLIIILALVGILVSIGIINYLSAVLRSQEEKAGEYPPFLYTIVQSLITLVFLSPTILLLVVSITLCSAPGSILNSLHFGWLIAIYITCFVVSLIVNCVLLKKRAAESYDEDNFVMNKIVHRSVLSLICSVAFLVIMIVGLIQTSSHTYQIATSKDLNLLKNLPSARSQHYVLVDDIDCADNDCSWFSAVDDFDGSIDGNNYIIKNINVSKIESSKSMFATNSGVISGLGLHFIGDLEKSYSFNYICNENKGELTNCTVITDSISVLVTSFGYKTNIGTSGSPKVDVYNTPTTGKYKIYYDAACGYYADGAYLTITNSTSGSTVLSETLVYSKEGTVEFSANAGDSIKISTRRYYDAYPGYYSDFRVIIETETARVIE